MIGPFILFALACLVSVIYGYQWGCREQRQADARALARMAREGAREMASVTELERRA